MSNPPIKPFNPPPVTDFGNPLGRARARAGEIDSMPEVNRPTPAEPGSSCLLCGRTRDEHTIDHQGYRCPDPATPAAPSLRASAAAETLRGVHSTPAQVVQELLDGARILAMLGKESAIDLPGATGEQLPGLLAALKIASTNCREALELAAFVTERITPAIDRTHKERRLGEPVPIGILPAGAVCSVVDSKEARWRTSDGPEVIVVKLWIGVEREVGSPCKVVVVGSGEIGSLPEGAIVREVRFA